jgi:hypothetical protein
VARAAGSELSAVAGAYASGGGTIPACEFSSAQLGAALSEAGGDIQQYGSDLLAAIQRALSERASGACGKHAAAAPPAVTATTPVPPVASPRPAAPAVAAPPAPPAGPAPVIPPVRIAPRPVSAATGSGLPAPMWTLAVVAVLVAAALLGWLLVRTRGWDPLWAQAARHSWREAGYRFSGAWADFADWARTSGR